MPSCQEKVLHAQARLFLHAQNTPPFSSFRDPKFAEILRMVPTEPGQMKVKYKPILSAEKLKEHVDAEHELFHRFLHEMLEPLAEQSFGQPFAQVLHDAVTLSNKFKHCSVATQFVDNE